MGIKIAIYSITKNEIKFVEKFMKSCEPADVIVVSDTGSDDGTPEKLRELGATVHNIRVSWSDWPKENQEKWRERLNGPWRFDVARNKSLFNVPEDIDLCISLDLDEVLLPGWREELEKVWTPKSTKIRYEYIWSHLQDGSPDVVYWAEKIHTRKDYTWRHPVHECLYYTGKKKEKHIWSNLRVEHFPDNNKSRSNYFPLLELAVEEDPKNDRNSHYLGREYLFNKDYKKAKKEFKRHISLPTALWNAERSASMRYLAKCCLALKENGEHISWLRKACAEAPGEREPWLELAQAHFNEKDYLGGYYAAKMALRIDKRPLSYITSGFAWGSYPYDLAGTCAFYIGMLEEAQNLTEKAYEMNPNDERVTANLKFIKDKNGFSPVQEDHQAKA